MKSVYDTVIPPSEYLILVDEIAMFMLATEEKTDYWNIMLGSFLDLLEQVNFFLNESSKRSETCASSNENNFLPFHSISKCRFPQFSSKLFRLPQEML